MGLINLTTNLKGLGFGDDRYKRGNSNEPYIQTQIPATNEPLQTGFSLSGDNIIGSLGGIAAATTTGFLLSGLNPLGAAVGLGVGIAGAVVTNNFQVGFKAPSAGTGGPDFLLRGGTLLPDRIVNDVERISKLIIDTKSAKGFLFTTKQNLLSRVAVKTEGTQGSLLNDGVYLPTSTLASVAGIALGGYFNKQGANPFSGIGEEYVPNKYYDNVKKQLTTNIFVGDNEILPNRLFTLYETKIKNDSIFNTNEINTNDILNVMSYRGGPGAFLGIGKTNIKIIDELQRTGINNLNLKNGYSQDNFQLNVNKLNDFREEVGAKYVGVYSDNSLRNRYLKYLKSLESSINGTGPSSQTTQVGELGEGLNPETYFSGGQRIVRSSTPIVDEFTAFGRTIIPEGGKATSALALRTFEVIAETPKVGDRKTYLRDFFRNIEADNYYKLGTVSDRNPDIIDFAISFIDGDYFYFPAYIETFDDGFTADWKSEKFMGRGENFYTYNGFDRSISLSFKTYARNLSVMPLMYSHLNMVASSLAPKYNNGGFMTGNISKITLGEYIKDLPGVITSFKFSRVISPEISWDVDAQLPYMFDVSMDFKPIHNFLPQFGNTFFGGGYNFDEHPMALREQRLEDQENPITPITPNPISVPTSPRPPFTPLG